MALGVMSRGCCTTEVPWEPVSVNCVYTAALGNPPQGSDRRDSHARTWTGGSPAAVVSLADFWDKRSRIALTGGPPPPRCWYANVVSYPWDENDCGTGVPYLDVGCDCAWACPIAWESGEYDALVFCCSRLWRSCAIDSDFEGAGDGGVLCSIFYGCCGSNIPKALSLRGALALQIPPKSG